MMTSRGEHGTGKEMQEGMRADLFLKIIVISNQRVKRREPLTRAFESKWDKKMETPRRTAARANCFDASALVKLHVEETGSDIIRQYAETEPTKYTTPYCFYEALSVLKMKWLYRKEISKEEYHDASISLTSCTQSGVGPS